MLQNNPNFVFCTETWLHSQISNSTIYVDGFEIIRKDRNNKRGGGVCVFYQKNLVLTLHDLKDVPNSCEVICFEYGKILFFVLYLPPSTPTEEVNSCFNIIIEKVDDINIKAPYKRICIVGDLNRFPIKFLGNELDLKNIVTQNTRKNSLLDYCLFSKDISSNYSTCVKDPIGSSDHNTIFCYHAEKKPSIKIKKEFLDLRMSNLAAYRQAVFNICWESVYYMTDINEKCNYFTNSLLSSISTIPKFQITMSSTDKQWVTPLCKHLINCRWKAFRENNFSKYEFYKTKVQSEIKKAKRLWYLKCKETVGGMWSFLKKTNVKSAGDIINLKDSGETDKSFADRINYELIKVHSSHSTTIQHNSSIANQTVTFNPLEVENQLLQLKGSKATGSDGLPNSLLRIVSDLIALPLSHIFNSIITHCKFPDIWKTSCIVALPKTNPPSISKLRPISLLPNVSKIFEKLLLQRIMPYFIKEIKKDQHGFMPKSSTISCLIKIQNSTTNYLEIENIKAVSLISFDLRRAFDSLPHSFLLQKLSLILPQNIFHLISDYLLNRFQCVKICDSFSDYLPVKSGVPQGSLLSPFLFNLYINDLDFGKNCTLFKYADDTTLIIPHFNKNISQDIEENITTMRKWCDMNGILLNTDKTQIMTCRKDKTITLHSSHKKEIKILGVTFNDTLKWDNHVQNICKAASKRIHILKTMKHYAPTKDLIIIYKSMIESSLLYGSALYLNPPMHICNQITRIYKRCKKVICIHNCRCIDEPMSRAISQASKLFLKAAADSGHPLHSIIPKRLQFCGKYCQPIAKTNRRKNAFIPTATKIINMLY